MPHFEVKTRRRRVGERARVRGAKDGTRREGRQIERKRRAALKRGERRGGGEAGSLGGSPVGEKSGKQI